MRSRTRSLSSVGRRSSRPVTRRTVQASQMKFGQSEMEGSWRPAPAWRRVVNGGPARKQRVWYADRHGRISSKPRSAKVHVRRASPWQKLSLQPTHVRCLLSVPPREGGVGRPLQPFGGGKRTMVRSQVQDNDRDGQHRRGVELLGVGEDEVHLPEEPRQLAPVRFHDPRDKEQSRGGSGQFHPGVQDERQNLMGKFRRGEPHGKLA